MARPSCATAFPCSAASVYSRRASTSCRGPPRPSASMPPRSACASGCPCSAASRSSRRASTSS
eukprot:2670569-Prymnesium_polylepis.1